MVAIFGVVAVVNSLVVSVDVDFGVVTVVDWVVGLVVEASVVSTGGRYVGAGVLGFEVVIIVVIFGVVGVVNCLVVSVVIVDLGVDASVVTIGGKYVGAGVLGV